MKRSWRSAREPYALGGVVFDWAGTTVDYGCLAPAEAFVAAFRRHGVELSVAEARGPMGLAKKDHVRVLLAMEPVRQRWRQEHGTTPGEEAVEAVYADVEPMLLDSVRAHTELIPGILELVEELRRRGAKIGSTTGYTHQIMEVLAPEARRQGFQLLALSAHEKGLEYACLVAPEVPALLRGNPGRLRQVLVNLMGNAVKFTERGEVRLEVALQTEAEDAVVLRFAVSDTGIGIPPDRKGDLFEAFTQVDASTTRRYGGTGLGLSISRRLVQLMRGSLDFDSELGKGSTFHFSVELAKQQGPPERADPRARPGALAGTRILVLDGSPTARRVLCTYLQSWRCTCLEADSGQGALGVLHAAVAHADPVDAALVNIPLADMAAGGFASALRAEPALSAVRLLATTAIGGRGEAAQLEREGYCGYLTKPIKRAALHDSLGIALAQIGAPAAPPFFTHHSLAEIDKRSHPILVAEDDPVNQKVALRLLQRLGYAADLVADGAQALQAMGRKPYELVLMDVQMPVLGGLEATQAIRGGDAGALDPQVPIVALTAHALSGERERFLEAGVSDYLSKPIDVAELERVLKRFLGAEAHPAGRSLSEMAPGKPDLEAGKLRDLVQDDELAATITGEFLEDASRTLVELREQMRAPQPAAVARLAHRLKSAAGSVGAVVVQELCGRLEAQAQRGELGRAPGLLKEITGSLSRVAAMHLAAQSGEAEAGQ